MPLGEDYTELEDRRDDEIFEKTLREPLQTYQAACMLDLLLVLQPCQVHGKMQAQRLVTQPVKRSSHCNLRVLEAQTPPCGARREARDLRGRLAAAADAARRRGLGAPRRASGVWRRPVLDLGRGLFERVGVAAGPAVKQEVLRRLQA